MGTSWISRKGGILEKEGEGMTTFTNSEITNSDGHKIEPCSTPQQIK